MRTNGMSPLADNKPVNNSGRFLGGCARQPGTSQQSSDTNLSIAPAKIGFKRNVKHDYANLPGGEVPNTMRLSESEGFSTDTEDTSSATLNQPSSRLASTNNRPSLSTDSNAESCFTVQWNRYGERVAMRQRTAVVPNEVVTANFAYKAKKEDELTLQRGSVIEVLSKDAHVSGGEGWWTGRLDGTVGVFPANYVQANALVALDTLKHSLHMPEPPEIHTKDIEIGKIIGVGGFCKVYLSTLLTTGETVAVKQARYDTDAEMDAVVEAVRQEARLFHLLSHKNIVTLRGVCLEKPNLWLILEYCAGGPLNRLLAGGGSRIPADVLIDWAIQCAKGMRYLHDGAPVSLVHRDLKSANVLVKEDVRLGPDGELVHSSGAPYTAPLTLKITDFGLAREAGHTTRMSMCGTYAWMAPEVIKCSTFSKGSDVWSFGVFLWELLTGETPYRNIDALAVAYGVAMGDLSLPVPESCPDQLRDIMFNCWEREPHKRPSFADLQYSLEQLSEAWNALDWDDANFHSLQADWRREIEQTFDELRQKESELRRWEDKLKQECQRVEEETKRVKEERERVETIWAALHQRELDIVQKEVQMLLNGKNQTGKPEVQEREKKSRLRKFAKFAWPKKAHAAGQLISAPTDFRHHIAVRASSESPPGSPTGRGPSAAPPALRVFHNADEHQQKHSIVPVANKKSSSGLKTPDLDLGRAVFFDVKESTENGVDEENGSEKNVGSSPETPKAPDTTPIAAPKESNMSTLERLKKRYDNRPAAPKNGVKKPAAKMGKSELKPPSVARNWVGGSTPNLHKICTGAALGGNTLQQVHPSAVLDMAHGKTGGAKVQNHHAPPVKSDPNFGSEVDKVALDVGRQGRAQNRKSARRRALSAKATAYMELVHLAQNGDICRAVANDTYDEVELRSLPSNVDFTYGGECDMPVTPRKNTSASSGVGASSSSLLSTPRRSAKTAGASPAGRHGHAMASGVGAMGSVPGAIIAVGHIAACPVLRSDMRVQLSAAVERGQDKHLQQQLLSLGPALSDTSPGQFYIMGENASAHIDTLSTSHEQSHHSQKPRRQAPGAPVPGASGPQLAPSQHRVDMSALSMGAGGRAMGATTGFFLGQHQSNRQESGGSPFRRSAGTRSSGGTGRASGSNVAGASMPVQVPLAVARSCGLNIDAQGSAPPPCGTHAATISGGGQFVSILDTRVPLMPHGQQPHQHQQHGAGGAVMWERSPAAPPPLSARGFRGQMQQSTSVTSPSGDVPGRSSRGPQPSSNTQTFRRTPASTPLSDSGSSQQTFLMCPASSSSMCPTSAPSPSTTQPQLMWTQQHSGAVGQPPSSGSMSGRYRRGREREGKTSPRTKAVWNPGYEPCRVTDHLSPTQSGGYAPERPRTLDLGARSPATPAESGISTATTGSLHSAHDGSQGPGGYSSTSSSLGGKCGSGGAMGGPPVHRTPPVPPRANAVAARRLTEDGDPGGAVGRSLSPVIHSPPDAF